MEPTILKTPRIYNGAGIYKTGAEGGGGGGVPGDYDTGNYILCGNYSDQYLDLVTDCSSNYMVNIIFSITSSIENKAICSLFSEDQQYFDTLFLQASGATFNVMSCRPRYGSRNGFNNYLGNDIFNNDIEIIDSRLLFAIQINSKNMAAGTFHSRTDSYNLKKIRLFEVNNGAVGTIKGKNIKIGKITITDNSVLKHSFVPVKKGNQIGMFDIVTQTFNSDGNTNNLQLV